MDYNLLENELKKRLNYPYIWGRKQTDNFDKQTNFIYETFFFEELLDKIESNFKNELDYNQLKNYTLNRWFNFWSAKAIETIFCENENVKAHSNSKDKYTDFYISTIPFDHKTTVFPKGFKKSVPFAIEHKNELIEWLYLNQSQQKRQHTKNRLFLVVLDYLNPNDNWKLKAEIGWMKQIISAYLRSFDSSKLCKIPNRDSTINADIIWAIK
jgi:hypothetical protein